VAGSPIGVPTLTFAASCLLPFAVWLFSVLVNPNLIFFCGCVLFVCWIAHALGCDGFVWVVVVLALSPCLSLVPLLSLALFW
jgi:hypothetical protein